MAIDKLEKKAESKSSERSTIVRYTVTFKDYNGDVIKVDRVRKAEDATPPSNPIREGYKFIRWDKNYTNVKDNLIITALYEKDAELKEDFIIDTTDSLDGKMTLKDQIISGDLILNGGGEVTLRNVVVMGKIIVNDISENSLYLDNVDVDKIEVNDTNGARIVTSELIARDNLDGLTNVVEIEINGDVLLEGDFNQATININNTADVEIGSKTSIAEVNVKAEGVNLKSSGGAEEIAAAIGSISGQVQEDLKTKIDTNKEKIADLMNKLNSIPAESTESMKDYLSRGNEARIVLEELLGDKIGADYNNYPEYAKVRTANTMRSFMQHDRFASVNAVEAAFQEAKVWNRVFGEGMKYAAYQGHSVKGDDYEWPVISKDTKVGTDITDIVMRLANDVGTDKLDLDPDIEIAILEEDDWNNGYYLEIEGQTIKLNRLNKTNRDILVSISFSIYDNLTKKSSNTNFIVTLESQTSDIEGLELSSNNYEIISKIDNGKCRISTYDNITVSDFIRAINSGETEDLLKLIDSNEAVVSSGKVNSSMLLEVTRGENKAYYTILAKPILSFEEGTVIKDIDREITVYPNQTVQDVINSINTNHIYDIIIEDEDGKSMNPEEVVTGKMELFIDVGNAWYGYNISIYIGEIELSSKDELIVRAIDNSEKWIFTFDDVSVDELLEAIVFEDGDTISVVNNEGDVTNGNTLVDDSMKLEISRGGIEGYYGIIATPVLSIKEGQGDVINHIERGGTITVYDGVIIGELLDAIETGFENYKLFINDASRTKITDDSIIVSKDMKLVVDTGYGESKFAIDLIN